MFCMSLKVLYFDSRFAYLSSVVALSLLWLLLEVFQAFTVRLVAIIIAPADILLWPGGTINTSPVICRRRREHFATFVTLPFLHLLLLFSLVLIILQKPPLFSIPA